MADDPVRGAVDDAFAQILELPSLDKLRAEFAAEPVICDRLLGGDLPVLQDDQLQLELI